MPDPYLIGVQELIDRPGEQLERSLVLPARADLGAGLASVPEGSDLHLDLRLESVQEGILATGRLRFHVHALSARTLEPLEWDDEVEFQELFEYDRPEDPGRRDEDDDVMLVERDHIDLDQAVRDVLVLRLPFKPSGGDEPEVNASFGEVAEPEAETHSGSDIDPRWQALTALVQQDDADDAQGSPGARGGREA